MPSLRLQAGGAVDANHSLMVSRSAFLNVSAATDGGALASRGPVEVFSSSFTNVSAPARGGAVRGLTSVSVTDSVFSSVACAGGPGGALFASEDLTVAGASRFVGVAAGGAGGAAFAGLTLTVTGAAEFVDVASALQARPAAPVPSRDAFAQFVISMLAANAFSICPAAGESARPA